MPTKGSKRKKEQGSKKVTAKKLKAQEQEKKKKAQEKKSKAQSHTGKWPPIKEGEDLETRFDRQDFRIHGVCDPDAKENPTHDEILAKRLLKTKVKKDGQEVEVPLVRVGHPS